MMIRQPEQVDEALLERRGDGHLQEGAARGRAGTARALGEGLAAQAMQPIAVA
jgi:hypothetical protein